MKPSIDIVVVNYKTYPILQRFLDSYSKFKPIISSNLIIIDNESDKSKLDLINKPKDSLTFAFNENIGYAKACNYAASISNSEYIAFLNSDTEFINGDCVDTCVEYMEDNLDVAVVGPLQYASNGEITHGGILGTNKNPVHRGWGSMDVSSYKDIQQAITVSGSAYFVRRSIWNEMMNCEIYKGMFPNSLGAFPPFPHFYEETLYSYHVTEHDYKCVYLGTAEMIHEWHQSSPIGSQDENFKLGRKGFREFCESHGIACD